eukprot:1139833-Pelagomonas_calceolata.AAC.1
MSILACINKWARYAEKTEPKSDCLLRIAGRTARHGLNPPSDTVGKYNDGQLSERKKYKKKKSRRGRLHTNIPVL